MYQPTYQMIEMLQADRLRAAERYRLGRQGLDVLTDETSVPPMPRRRGLASRWLRREPVGTAL